MRPRRTPKSNTVFRLDGGTEDNDLWVERTLLTDDDLAREDPGVGAPASRSVWELSDEERKAIADGAAVRLTVIGIQHPPVALEVVRASFGKAAERS